MVDFALWNSKAHKLSINLDKAATVYGRSVAKHTLRWIEVEADGRKFPCQAIVFPDNFKAPVDIGKAIAGLGFYFIVKTDDGMAIVLTSDSDKAELDFLRNQSQRFELTCAHQAETCDVVHEIALRLANVPGVPRDVRIALHAIAGGETGVDCLVDEPVEEAG